MSASPSQPYPSELARAWSAKIVRGPGGDLTVRGVRQGGLSVLRMGCSYDDHALRVGGVEYKNGLGTHADSEIEIGATAPLGRFTAVVGFDQNRVTRGGEALTSRIVFSVEAGGRELWRSRELGLDDAGEKADVPLPEGTRALTLRVTGVEGKTDRAHADWVEARVQFSDGRWAEIDGIDFPDVPFSFTYGGKSSADLLPRWPRTVGSAEEPGKKVHTVAWNDPETGLECRLEWTEFSDHPAVEWIVHFRNKGSRDTPILENVQALDVDWKIHRLGHGDLAAEIWRSRGSNFRITDFEYLTERLFLHEQIHMKPGGGRSSQGWLPFFNAGLGKLGVITAIGWTGQWECRLEHRPADRLRMRAGLEKMHLKLLPGEEIRTPRIAQLFWEGDRLGGHNDWRRFLLRHHTPRTPAGEPVTGPFTIAHWGGMHTRSHLERIEVYRRERISRDYLWVDAGWYGLNSRYSPTDYISDWPLHTGDWRVSRETHPGGLRPIVEAAREAGMKFMLWFEPERVVRGTLWHQEHPEWFLERGDNLLLDFSNPAALQGAIELFSRLITEYGVSLFREDFNFEPLEYWRQNDAEDRQGMTEIRFTEGFYAFWDGLMERHPA